MNLDFSCFCDCWWRASAFGGKTAKVLWNHAVSTLTLAWLAVLALTLSVQKLAAQDISDIRVQHIPSAVLPPHVISFNNGVTFTEPDSVFQLSLRFRIQNLAQVQTRSVEDVSIDRVLWNVRRLRLRFSGFVADTSLTFLLQLSMSRNDLDWDNSEFPNIIRDAVIYWRPIPSLQLGFGLTKLPGNRQRVVSSSEMQMIDRSIVNAAFNVDRDFGFQAVYALLLGSSASSARIHARGALTTGDGRNTVVANPGLSYTGRIEVLPFGQFARNGDYVEGDIEREEAPKLSLAVGYSQNNNARRTGGQLGTQLFAERSMGTWLADALVKYRGFSLYAEYAARSVLRGESPITTDASGTQKFVYDGAGVNVQAGYFVAEQWELVGRYATIVPNASIYKVAQQQTHYTAGVNYYLNRHRIKVQTDITFESFHNKLTNAQTASWIGRFQVEFGI
jgi:hypothetical protein